MCLNGHRGERIIALKSLASPDFFFFFFPWDLQGSSQSIQRSRWQHEETWSVTCQSCTYKRHVTLVWELPLQGPCKSCHRNRRTREEQARTGRNSCKCVFCRNAAAAAFMRWIINIAKLIVQSGNFQVLWTGIESCWKRKHLISQFLRQRVVPFIVWICLGVALRSSNLIFYHSWRLPFLVCPDAFNTCRYCTRPAIRAIRARFLCLRETANHPLVSLAETCQRLQLIAAWLINSIPQTGSALHDPARKRGRDPTSGVKTGWEWERKTPLLLFRGIGLMWEQPVSHRGKQSKAMSDSRLCRRSRDCL